MLTRTLRLGLGDIFQVLSNFLGLRPSLIPTGSHLFTVDVDNCRKSLLLDEPKRREVLAGALAEIRWDILATNLTRREARYFNVNEILSEIDDRSLGKFMEAFLAGITTIPYFRAITIDEEYHIEGGYLDNTPMRTMFADPEVDEIIAIDFTDYDYHAGLEKIYSEPALHSAVQQHRYPSADQRHATDPAQRQDLCPCPGNQRVSGGHGQRQAGR